MLEPNLLRALRRIGKPVYRLTRAWQALQERKNIERLRLALGPWVREQLWLDSNVLAPTSSQWQHHCTEDGDVESHPGLSPHSNHDAAAASPASV